MELNFLKIFKINKTSYDNIIPLGFNCQLAFNINRVHHYLESHLFNWAFILDENKFLKALNNLELIFQNGYSYRKDSNMFECLTTGIVFHGKHTIDDIKNNNIEIYDANIIAEYNDLQERNKHLITKLENLMKSNKSKCFMYVLKTNQSTIKESINFVNTLYTTLLSKTTHFDLVIICENEYYSEIKKHINKSIICRKIKKLAPITATTDETKTDIVAWNKILKEFKIKTPIISKQKIYKFEKEKQNG